MKIIKLSFAGLKPRSNSHALILPRDKVKQPIKSGTNRPADQHKNTKNHSNLKVSFISFIIF